MGLPLQIIQNIADFGGEGIAFICTECRATTSASGGNGNRDGDAISVGAFKQLHQTVKTLCKTVQELSEQVRVMTCNPQPAHRQSPSPPVSQPPSSDNLRLTIREEIREMDERQKRKHSQIMKGWKTTTTAQASEFFKQLTQKLIGSEILPDTIQLIPNTTNNKMYRIKITDDDSRNQLLANAKNIRNLPDYDSVYISRDLTYKQRQDLYHKRQAKATSNTNQTNISAQADVNLQASQA